MSNANWIEFLKSQGASINSEENQLTFPEHATQADKPRLTPLLDQALLQLQGVDTNTFLQGQLSCDLTLLSTEKSLLGSNCTPKGNVISAFRLIRQTEEQVLLRLPKSISLQAQANLNKYIVFSKADLTDVSDDYVGLGLQGAQAEALIRELFSVESTAVDEQCLVEQLMIIRVPGTIARFELWMPASQAIDTYSQLAAKTQPASTDAWLLGEIQAGLVQLDAESVDNYLPQMLNLQAVDGVSFSKGCYTGQEVITRLQYRGKLKKLLARGSVGSDLQPIPGMALHSPKRKSVGKVLASAPVYAADGSIQGYELQAVISKNAMDDNQLRLDSQEGPAVELLALPYDIDPELFER